MNQISSLLSALFTLVIGALLWMDGRLFGVLLVLVGFLLLADEALKRRGGWRRQRLILAVTGMGLFACFGVVVGGLILVGSIGGGTAEGILSVCAGIGAGILAGITLKQAPEAERSAPD